MLVINCKNYAEVMTVDSVRLLVEAARRSSARHGVTIAVAPPPPLLAVAAEAARTGARSRARGGRSRAPASSRPLVFSQHADNVGKGSTTGSVVAEAIRAAGADGSLLNHSEYRISGQRRRGAVAKLRRQRLLSVICVTNPAEAYAMSLLKPDYVAVEPTALIGTGRAISKEKPTLIARAARAVERAVKPRGRVSLLCGAGITSADDVRLAVELGSKGILVASGLVKAKNRAAAIDSFAAALASASRARKEG